MKYIFKIFLLILAMSQPAFAGGKVYFYHTDPAGTPLAMVDSAGARVWTADYKPFGEEQSTTGTVDNNRRFVGKEKDQETGLVYFGARFVSDETGRFISPDAVGPVDPGTSKTNETLLQNPQRLNKYAYGLNNPYRYVDPDGNFPIDTFWDIGNVLYDVYTRDWASAAADGAAVLIPYVPAGITKVAKGADKAIDASKAVKDADKFSRAPKGLFDQMVLDAAKQGKGVRIFENLNDPKFKGMEKWSYTEKSRLGFRSEVHYVRNPKTGELMDFKFKHHDAKYY